MKNCIFCKKDSSNSNSVEHIVPESLGNKSHILQKGVVCDECNNYFSLKIEKPVLEQEFFKNLRHRNKISSKKGRIPEGKVIVPYFLSEGSVKFHKNNTIISLDSNAFQAIVDGKISKLIVPYNTTPLEKDRTLSRFLGKMALEALFDRISDAKNSRIFFINNSDFDPLRDYVRYNKGKQIWNYSIRKVYEEDEQFQYNLEILDMIFEYDFLLTEYQEVYFIIVITRI
nr:HNH endonuclease [uncultured Emticicia sp.]